MGNIKISGISAVLLFTLCVVFHPAIGVAEKEPPIVVEADQMSSTEESNTVLFLGNVDAKQGDLRILSDEMTVYYLEEATADKEASTEQKIEKLVCVGNVELSSAEWLGTSDQMIYYSGNRKVLLVGNAKAWQGENMISGEKIVYYMDEGRSEVVGGTTMVVGEGEEKQEKKSRVKMTIMQK
ncbi:MAG: lipopolysaccharide transport periplasmic protein LptA [Desulfofustis sp.]|nr:lipopolysaccharide transport periplasmic protein LptA [Desulfofustis sp.]MBT8353184.1 lipopolysaccharide transport periplasmic protein LptA [Desulfofustis sp.]NNK14468.1 lipopolysaccharide transport periplasmic protein LptA [Desulfofustis sp.]NNK56624.1 lipopolysaccharide transport periplasmic protein LptA [Desulfofustis sp.]